MVKIQNEKDCCGCGACQAACPVGCIEMKTRTLGAVFPSVNTETCTGCNRCEVVCPVLHVSMNHVEEQKVFAAYALDEKTRFQGSSGGMFGVFAKHLLAQGYRVYGAAFDGALQLKCMPADSETSLERLMKSKYLQSDMTSVYKQIRSELELGQNIMFVAAPCQAAALRRFLGKDYKNLVLVDFVCHGVPSQVLFNQCLAYEDRRHQCRTLNYAFRTKIPNGATPHYFTVEIEKKGKIKRVTLPYFRSVFYAFFQRYITLRESCYDCVFSEKERVSDITMGDFHTIERYAPDINRFDGVSTVIINTEKGNAIFESIRGNVWSQQFSADQLIQDGVLFAEKTKRPADRDAFVKSYESLPFDDFVRKNMPRKKYFIYSIYYRLPQRIRAIAKRICHIE